MKRRLLILTVILSLLMSSALFWLLFTDSGLRQAYRMAQPWIPGELVIENLRGHLAGTISLDAGSYRTGGHHITVGPTTLRWSPMALLRARLHLQQLQSRVVEVYIGPDDEDERSGPSPRLLPIGFTVNDSQVADITIRYKDSIIKLDEVQLRGHSMLQRLDIADLSVSAEEFSARIQGQLRFTGRKGNNRIRLTGSGKGHYRPLGQLHGAFDLSLLQDNSFQVSKLNLLSPATGSDVDFYGHWAPGAKGGAIDGALHWRRLHWPASGTPWFDSAGGSAWINGHIEDYQVGLSTENPWPQTPSSTWHASARGNLSGLDFHSLRIVGLGGELLARGEIGWSGRFSWRARASLKGIDPGGLWRQWPGRITATAASEGRLRKDGFHGRLVLSDVHGSLRDHPLRAEARLRLAADALTVEDLRLESGSSTAKLSGTAGERLNLDWRLSSDNLAELDGRIRGQLQARGRLSGRRDSPRLSLKVLGKDIGSSGYGVSQLQLDGNLDLPGTRQLDVKASLQGLDAKGFAIPSLELKSTASDNHYNLQLSSTLDQGRVALAADLSRDADRWQGRISTIDLILDNSSNWHLKQEVPLNWSKHEGELRSLCLGDGDGEICVDASHRRQQTAAQLELRALPLSLLSPWLPPELRLDGVVNGGADIRHQATKGLTGTAELRLPAGALHYPPLQNRDQPWAWQSIVARLEMRQDGARIEAAASMDEQDRISVRAELPGARLPALDRRTQAINGNAYLLVRRLKHLEGLLPELHNVQGVAEARVGIGGTLAAPQLSVNAGLRDGELQIPRLGLKITDLQLNASSRDDYRLDYQLQARSGKGQLGVDGQTLMDPARGWQTSIHLKGQNFEVASIPEAKVLATPDLNLHLQGRDIQIDGELHIPSARLRPRDLTTLVGPSDDVVIVGSRAEKEQKWAITSSVRLGFGDQVFFDGFGFDGRFFGAVLVTEEPGQATRATGQMDIPEGRYRAYGQRLDVEHGRLLYAGGPLDNPGLDIKANRQVQEVIAGLKVRGTLHQPKVELYSVPAMSQIDALSYLLLGRKLEGATEDEGAMMARAALALGLKGGDLLARDLGDRFGLDEMHIESSAEGDKASLVMGRYLSPRLYISYGVGLIENVNVFSVRYQISNSWQLKAESGETQGADLLYTIER